MTRSAKTNLWAGATLAAGIVVLFLHPADQYFFGDSISTLITRSLTWKASFLDLFRLGGSHWYRPLTNGFVQFLVWPLFGLNFAPYHYLAMAMHWAVCFGLFLALRRVVEDEFAAWAGAAFFAFHPIAFYATYDVCFYQEPMGAGLTLAATALLYWYVQRGKNWALAIGLILFLLALAAREIGVLTAAVLTVMVWPPANRRAFGVIGIAGAISAAFTAVYLFVMHPLRYQPSNYSSDWSPKHLFENLWTCAQWAFGIATGPQTDGWRSPAIIQVALWAFFAMAVASVFIFWGRQPQVWRGPAFFVAASIAALSTHRLWPHHIYLGVMGISLWIAAALACWRRTGISTRFAPRIVAAVLSCIFMTAAIGARYDSANSWVGLNSWETRLPALYEKSLFRDLPKWRGVWVVVKEGDPSFSWLYGQLFRLMAGDREQEFETRLMPAPPDTAPQGIHVFEYRNSMLWPLPIPVSTVAAVPHVSLRIEPTEVHPGTSYRVIAPELAGRAMDLRYSYNDHLPDVAYSFVTLRSDGTAEVPTPPDTPWGVVEVLGVRPSGAAEWSPVRVRVEVLRD